jgi:hypothetical protein
MTSAGWRWVVAGGVLASAGWVTADAVVEAFGAGPPYYSRTTNMDKWENPMPMLATVDLVALAVAGALLKPLLTRTR